MESSMGSNWIMARNTMKITGEMMKTRQDVREEVEQEQIQKESVNSPAVYLEGRPADANPTDVEQDIPDDS